MESSSSGAKTVSVAMVVTNPGLLSIILDVLQIINFA